MKKIFLTIFLFIALYWPRYISAQVFNEKPETIIIPSVEIALPVEEADIQTDTWEVRLDSASFGSGSDLPGNNGNTIIFSHALSQLFASLLQVKIGDEVHVFTLHDWFRYKIIKTEIVDPSNIDAIKSSKSNELTLFTCAGPWYSQRFVVKARLEQNISSLQ